MEKETSEIALFVGRFHPLILHLPIGFLTLAFILELLSRKKKFSHFKYSVAFVLLLGCASSIVAAVPGYLLAQSGGYHEDILSLHQWSGIAVALMSAGALFVQWLCKRRPSVVLDRVYLATLSTMMLSLTVAGHYGGSLTHGSDYLSQYMPNGLRSIMGLPANEQDQMTKITNLDSALVYKDIIDPLFKTYCTSCHNESKSKGNLMMHTPEYLMKGGANGAILRPGDAAMSSMIQRIHLPESHEDHMPPEGKRQLSQGQVALLEWWINSGASFDKRIADVEVPDDVQQILDGLVEPGARKSGAGSLLTTNTHPVGEETLMQLRAKGVSVSPLSDEIHWLQASVAPSVNADSMLLAFSVVSDHLTWLSLGGSSVTDESLTAVGTFKNLTRLDLRNTRVTDEGLQHIKELTYLESLNLYGTSVTDKCIESLAALKNLKTLYLWQTEVSADGASHLEKAIPGVRVNLGEEMSSN